MSTVTSPPPVPRVFPDDWSLADVLEHLGSIPAERVRIWPPLGTATIEYLEAIDGQKPLCELIDGVLVEKTMGWYESVIAGLIVTEFNLYLRSHDLGKALGADGLLQVLPQQARLPDACVIRWERFPQERVPRRPIPELIPNLAVEVLSDTNTPAEMARKLNDYFTAGVELVWIIDPDSRSANVYTAVDEFTNVNESGALSGGGVLPGLEISLAELFAEADRQGPKK